MHPDVRGCGAQSAGPLDHSTERTFLRADCESWFRRAARDIVERAPGACVSAETTTRRDVPKKPVKKSRVAQPVVDALDRASIIAAYEEDTLAHSSVGRAPRVSLPYVGLVKHRSYFLGMAYISVTGAVLANWDSLLATLQISNVVVPNDQFCGESVREIETAAVICEDVSVDTVRRRVAPPLPRPTLHALRTPWSVSKTASLPLLPSFTFPVL